MTKNKISVTPSRHPEVAEPQQDRFMQNLVCCPASCSSGSINAYPQGNTLSRACSSLRSHNHDLSLDKGRGRFGFTLAEILITLAIIGVVAAMTIPTLISNYKKNVVESKLRKFNSNITQVVKLSEVDNGEITYWDTSSVQTFYNKYLANYIKTAKVDKISESQYNVYLQDGSAFIIRLLESGPLIHLNFFPDANTLFKEQDEKLGINSFIFLFYPVMGDKLTKDRFCNSPFMGDSTGFVPYLYTEYEYYWDSEKGCRRTVYPTGDDFTEMLMNDINYGCSTRGAYCTKLIQMNGWKIPENYPHKF